MSKPAAKWGKVAGHGGGVRALQCTVDARLLSAHGDTAGSGGAAVRLVFQGRAVTPDGAPRVPASTAPHIHERAFSPMYHCLEEGACYRIFLAERIAGASRSAATSPPAPAPAPAAASADCGGQRSGAAFLYPADLTKLPPVLYRVGSTTVVRRLAGARSCAAAVLSLSEALLQWVGARHAPPVPATVLLPLALAQAKHKTVTFRACIVGRRFDSRQLRASSSASAASCVTADAFLGVGDSALKLTLSVRSVLRVVRDAPVDRVAGVANGGDGADDDDASAGTRHPDSEWALGADVAQVYVDMPRSLLPTSALLELGCVATFHRFDRIVNSKGTNISFKSRVCPGARGSRIAIDDVALTLLGSPRAAREQHVVETRARGRGRGGGAAVASSSSPPSPRDGAAVLLQSLRPLHRARCWERVAARTIASLVAEPQALLRRAAVRLRCALISIVWFQVTPLDTGAAASGVTTPGICPDDSAAAAHVSADCQWKCTVDVDDGTGRASIQAEGDSAAQLLGCDAAEVRWIETLARSHRAQDGLRGVRLTSKIAALLRGAHLSTLGAAATGHYFQLLELVIWGFVNRAARVSVCARRYVTGTPPKAWQFKLCGAEVSTSKHRSVKLDVLHVAPIDVARAVREALAARSAADAPARSN